MTEYFIVSDILFLYMFLLNARIDFEYLREYIHIFYDGSVKEKVMNGKEIFYNEE